MAQQAHKPLSFEQRVKARERFVAAVDAPPPGPTPHKCVRVGNALINVKIDDGNERLGARR
jgi:hypothetical protein